MGVQVTNAAMMAALEATDGMVYLAADRLKCSAQTIYNRCKRNPAMMQFLKHAQERIVDTAETVLKTAITNRERWAVEFILKTKGKNRGYVEATEQRQTGHDGGPAPESKSDKVLARIADYTAAIVGLAGSPPAGDAAGDGAGERLDSVGANGTAGPIPGPR